MTNTGLTAKDQTRIESIIRRNAVIIERCGKELATNFTCPAQSTINLACSEMGITRLDWEKIEAVRNNTEFVAPPAKLLRRWASY